MRLLLEGTPAEQHVASSSSIPRSCMFNINLGRDLARVRPTMLSFVRGQLRVD